jgi:indolepyruvate ferredoxin oxidoreductase beta subunit
MSDPDPSASSPERSAYSVLLAGVGGQGVLFISELLALSAVEAGFDAKQTEIHGVSQRGGSVHSHVRFGPSVHSPLIPYGGADFVAGLEKLEAVRFARYAGRKGLVVINEHEERPISAGPAAEDTYPHDAPARLAALGHRVATLPATAVAETELGNRKVANVVVLGFVAARLPIEKEIWDQILDRRVPSRFRDLNRRAFDVGYAWTEASVPQRVVSGG